MERIVPFLSSSLKVVLKSPSIMTLASTCFDRRSVIFCFISLKKLVLFSSCEHGEWRLTIISFIFSLCSKISTREIWASYSRWSSSSTIMLSLSSVIKPPLFPQPSVNIWLPFQLNFKELCSIWVSCIANMRLVVPNCVQWILFTSWLYLFLFFRPRQFSVPNVTSIGPGFSSTSPLRFISRLTQSPIILAMPILMRYLITFEFNKFLLIKIVFSVLYFIVLEIVIVIGLTFKSLIVDTQ